MGIIKDTFNTQALRIHFRLARRPEPGYLQPIRMDLDASQLAAIRSRARRTIVEGGPGTGKTEVCARWAVGLIAEPSHNWRFQAMMDRFMPKWRIYYATLNSLPLRHENWRR